MIIDSGHKERSNAYQGVNYEVITSEARALEVLETISKHTVVGVDTETTGLDVFNDKVLLLQIAVPGKSFILNCSKVRSDVWNPILSAPNILKVIQNAKFDYKMLKNNANVSTRPIFDTMIAERLIAAGTNTPANLKYLALKYSGFEMDKSLGKQFAKKESSDFTQAEFLYAATDALILLDIYDAQLSVLEKNDLLRVARLEFDTLIPVMEMELNGCLIDVKKWNELLVIAEQKQKEAEKDVLNKISHVCPQLSVFGTPVVNIGSQKQMLDIFFRLGFRLTDTEENTLKSITHPVAKSLLEWRIWQKKCNTYGKKFLSKVNKATNRLHAEFNQIRARTGRFSSSNPNLQNVPRHEETNPHSLDFRSCFIPSKGYKMVAADYAAQELRVLAEYSRDKTLMEGFLNDEDMHTKVAQVLWPGVPVEELKISGKRTIAKTATFLIIYGGGPGKLAATTGISREEAELYMSSYLKVLPGVRDFINKYGNMAINEEYVTTISGRRRYFTLPSTKDEEFDYKISSVKRQGVNTVIQGSSADVSKKGLCHFFYTCEKKGYDMRLLLVVHDEIVCEVREDQAEEVAKVLEECMIKGFTDFFKTIPMKADADISDCWKKG